MTRSKIQIEASKKLLIYTQSNLDYLDLKELSLRVQIIENPNNQKYEDYWAKNKDLLS